MVCKSRKLKIKVTNLRNKLPSKKKVSIIKKMSVTDKSFCQRKKLLSQMHVDRNLIYNDTGICSPIDKCVKNEHFL